METSENLYELFEKCYQNNDVLAMEEFIADRVANPFFFTDLLYQKLFKCKDKNKVRLFVESDIFNDELKFDLICETCEAEEIEEFLLSMPSVLKENIEKLFSEEKIEPVKLLKKAIDLLGDDAIKIFMNHVARMGNNNDSQIKEILDYIGTDKIKEVITTYNGENKTDFIRKVMFLYKEEELFKDCIFDRSLKISDDLKIKMILLTGKRDLLFECVKRDKDLSETFIIECLKKIGDEEQVLEFLRNKKYHNKEKTFQLIMSFSKNEEFIKQCITDKELGIPPICVTLLLVELNDKKYVEEYINREENGLREQDIVFLKLMYEIGIEEYAKTIENEETRLNTPKKSTHGIEIECTGDMDQYIINAIVIDENLTLPVARNRKWTLSRDGSGTELASGVFRNDKNATNSIYYACHLLQSENFESTFEDGAHVHVGAHVLTSVQSYKNLLDMWLNVERAMFLISNKPGELPRLDAIAFDAYAAPRSEGMNKYIQEEKIKLQDDTIQSFIEAITWKMERYSSINLKNVLKPKGKQTIEYRIANGTVDPKIWIENINLFTAFTQAAEDLYIIQSKPEEERTKKEQAKLELFDIIKAQEANELKKLEAMLRIIMEDDKQRDIYRTRYRENSSLLKTDDKIKQSLDRGTAPYFIGFDSIEVGEQCFGETSEQLELEAYERLAKDRERGQAITK